MMSIPTTTSPPVSPIIVFLPMPLSSRVFDGLSMDGIAHDGSGASGSLGNPGWKLDKFKFLSMIDKALRQMPRAKWIVFVELDAYLMSTNLLDYFSQFDAEASHYIGKQMYILATCPLPTAAQSSFYRHQQ